MPVVAEQFAPSFAYAVFKKNRVVAFGVTVNPHNYVVTIR